MSQGNARNRIQKFHYASASHICTANRSQEPSLTIMPLPSLSIIAAAFEVFQNPCLGDADNDNKQPCETKWLLFYFRKRGKLTTA